MADRLPHHGLSALEPGFGDSPRTQWTRITCARCNKSARVGADSPAHQTGVCGRCHMGPRRPKAEMGGER